MLETSKLDANPLREGIRLERTGEPCTIVIFGATGDLAKRKLVPALFKLVQQRLVPAEFAVLGLGRTPMDDDGYRERMREAVLEFTDGRTIDEEVWSSFARSLHYLPSNIMKLDDFQKIKQRLDEIDREHGTQGNRIYYLSTAPEFYSPAVKHIGFSGLATPGRGWARVIIEKPFGTDLASARKLNAEILDHLDESQIYRIDHYLGKETVQNLMVFRFANGIFEPLWNRRYIDHVQITNAEAGGVESRGAYYEKAGVVRDMIQNHVFQVLSLIAMEPPARLQPEFVRDEKIKVLNTAREFTKERVQAECVRGQYGSGAINGVPVPGYRDENGVAPDSSTETYAMITTYFDNWRWSGVPFYIRSGKRLCKRITEIAIQFKDAPHQLFAGDLEQGTPNQLILRLQPDEGITMRFAAKVPGQLTRIRDVNMDFRYGASFGVPLAEAYERLILDCILGDSTLFARNDMAERGWEIVMPILREWEGQPAGRSFPNYEAGSWGPEAAFDMLRRHGRNWRRP
jgi:glucose-6-phosphate 1-dehydrogenase